MNTPLTDAGGNVSGKSWNFGGAFAERTFGNVPVACVLTVSLMFLSFPPVHIPSFAWFGLVPWVIATRRTSRLGVAMKAGFTCGACLSLLVLDWVRTASSAGFWDFGPHWQGWLLIGLFSGLSWSLGGGILWMLSRNRIPLAVAAPMVGLAIETLNDLQARVLAGTTADPLRVAITQVNWPGIIQLAQVGGSNLVAAFIFIANGVLGDVVSMWIESSSKRFSKMLTAISFAILVAGAAWATVIGNHADAKVMREIRVSLHASSAFHNSEHAANETTKVDLEVWPEMSNRRPLNELTSIGASSSGACRLSNYPSLVAGEWISESPLGLFNSLVFRTADGIIAGRYDKQWLCPLRETPTPVQRWWCRVTGTTTIDRFLPGSHTAGFGLTQGITFGVGICHDVLFPEWIRERTKLQSPDFFVVCSCESFDPTRRAQTCLRAITQLRAAEFQRPIVRCVTDGWSGIVLQNGQLVEPTVGLDKAANRTLVVRVPLR